MDERPTEEELAEADIKKSKYDEIWVQMVGYDTNGDGKVDQQLDTNGDGVIDSTILISQLNSAAATQVLNLVHPVYLSTRVPSVPTAVYTAVLYFWPRQNQRMARARRACAGFCKF